MKAFISCLLIYCSLCGFLTAQNGAYQTYNSQFALVTTEHVLTIATPLVMMANEIENAFPDVYTEAKNFTKQAHSCIENLKTDNMTVCSKLESVNYRCAVDLKTYYEQKLPRSAESIPRLIRDSYIKSVGHICKLQVKTFWEFMDECIETAHLDTLKAILKDQGVSTTAMKKAVKDHQDFLNGPTRSRLCRAMESAKDLTKQSLNTYCSNKVAVQAVSDLYDAAVSPCKHSDSL